MALRMRWKGLTDSLKRELSGRHSARKGLIDSLIRLLPWRLPARSVRTMGRGESEGRGGLSAYPSPLSGSLKEGPFHRTPLVENAVLPC